VSACALCDPGHEGARYRITGPEALSLRDQVRIIGEVLGRPLRYEEITPEVAREEMSTIMPPVIANMLLQAFAVAVDSPAPVTPVVEQVTGRPARTFCEWAAAEFQHGRA